MIDFDPANRLSVTECLARWEEVERQEVDNREQKKRQAVSMFEGSSNDTENNLRRWLNPVPSKGYDRRIKVGV